MISSLNERCLLKFLSSEEKKPFGTECELISLLDKMEVEIKKTSVNSLYDIIEEYENN